MWNRLITKTETLITVLHKQNVKHIHTSFTQLSLKTTALIHDFDRVISTVDHHNFIQQHTRF
jgi:hypothetical protein